jgi:hypothetical protein
MAGQQPVTHIVCVNTYLIAPSTQGVETIHIAHLHPKWIPAFKWGLGGGFSGWEIAEVSHPSILFFNIQIMHHLDPDAKCISDCPPYQTAEDFFEKRVVFH